MSWLSKITGIHLGNIGAPVGALLGSVIPGVGTSIGAGLGQGLGALGSHKNLKTAILQGAVAGGGTKLAGMAAGKLKGLLDAGKASGVPFPGSGMPMPDLSAVPGAVDSIGSKTAAELAKLGLSAGGGGASSSVIGSIAQAAAKGLIPRNKDGSIDWGGLLGKAAGVALPVAGAIQSSKQNAQADKYRQKAIDAVESAYKEAAPLRSMGLAGLTDPRMADVSSIFNQPRPQFRRLPV